MVRLTQLEPRQELFYPKHSNMSLPKNKYDRPTTETRIIIHDYPSSALTQRQRNSKPTKQLQYLAYLTYNHTLVITMNLPKIHPSTWSRFQDQSVNIPLISSKIHTFHPGQYQPTRTHSSPPAPPSNLQGISSSSSSSCWSHVAGRCRSSAKTKALLPGAKGCREPQLCGSKQGATRPA